MLKAQECVEAIIQIFFSILKGMETSTVLPWALITGSIFLLHKFRAQLCAAAARAQMMQSYIIEVAMKLSMLSNLEKWTKGRDIE